MNHSAPARAGTRRTPRSLAVGLVVVTAAVIGALAYQSASSSAQSSSDVLRGDHGGTTPKDVGVVAEYDGVVDEDDGALPDGVTIFDDEYPGVANLNPELLQAVRAAAMDAAEDGIEFDVNSGWRSPEYQDRLVREAVTEYGSEAEAARWVAIADTSAHLSGDAVDIGHVDARAWLSEYGAEYGLCQTYTNEPWHYELRPAAIAHGCPAMYADPTHDPRTYGDQEAPPIPPTPVPSQPPTLEMLPEAPPMTNP